jgi:glycosyltransferase involved in cell wall biosynthesis
VTKPLILISNPAIALDRYLREKDCGAIPGIDYFEIMLRMGGGISSNQTPQKTFDRLVRKIENILRIDILQANQAYRISGDYDVFLSASEKAAIPLAFLLRRSSKPHVVIAHRISSRRKMWFFRMSQLQRSFCQLICVSQPQAECAIQQLRFPAERVNLIRDKVDHRFFHPGTEPSEKFILAVGQEQRDYHTLTQAIEGTDFQLIIVASSPWSSYEPKIAQNGKVKVVSNISFPELRSLYARAQLVVLPLHDVDYAAGVNGLLEAMSMAKPVIASRSRGLEGYVSHLETGILVTPGDTTELHDAICSLWNDPQAQTVLGANARSAVESTMNLDIYVDQVVKVVEKAAA